jgi:hypothetical protein
MPTTAADRHDIDLTVEWVPISDLLFDSTNPRLAERGPETPQEEILEILWRDFAVDEIAFSIAANGYFEYEPLFAAKEGGAWVVVEGNRRLAAVKLLTDSRLRRKVDATDLPQLNATSRRKLETLPVVRADRADIWQYVGFKHVNGPQAWQSYSKAEYIAWVHNDLGVSLDEIARRIGDRHATVRRLYRAWMALAQAESAGVFSLEDRWKRHFSFSHLYTGFDYSGIQEFIGISPNRGFTEKPIPRSRLEQFAELCVWLYGSRSRDQQPLVQSQNPDLRNLDQVLQSRDGIAALRRGMPLGVALDISKGDERLFRESLITAKNELQAARGKLLTGYRGEADLRDVAEDILELAEAILEEMRERMQSPRKRSRSAGRSR